MKIPRCLLFVALFLGILVSADAQITVSLSIKRRLYIKHEPVLATVQMTNNTGRDIVLEDTPQAQWFSFRIAGADSTFVPPRNPNYHLDSLPIRAGETLKRTVNLNELYALGEFGIFSVRANIYFAGLDKDFSSAPSHIEITEGRQLWEKTVGVPEGTKGQGQPRTFTMLAHQAGEQNILYVRVQDKDDGTVFSTYALGRLLEGFPPQMQFDNGNNPYVLQLIGQRNYTLSTIGVNGEFLGQTNYTAPKVRPYMRKTDDGRLQLVNAEKVDKPNPQDLPEPAKLSDRPVPLPLKNK
jgi:hypothetical protein